MEKGNKLWFFASLSKSFKANIPKKKAVNMLGKVETKPYSKLLKLPFNTSNAKAPSAAGINIKKEYLTLL